MTHNATLLLNELQRKGTCSGADLQKSLGVSDTTTVFNALQELSKLKLIVSNRPFLMDNVDLLKAQFAPYGAQN